MRSRGERHGFAPALAAIAREKGCPARVGDDDDPSPAVHRADAAQVYRFAIERGAARPP